MQQLAEGCAAALEIELDRQGVQLLSDGLHGAASGLLTLLMRHRESAPEEVREMALCAIVGIAQTVLGCTIAVLPQQEHTAPSEQAGRPN
jgi:hypothetical protein